MAKELGIELVFAGIRGPEHKMLMVVRRPDLQT